VTDRIDVVAGDITEIRADAIVNAANRSLLGGGGVDGAIHRAAGPELREHNRGLGGCPTGCAKVTPAFDLASRGIRHIVHTVGPVWQRRDDGGDTPLGRIEQDVLLASCYRACLELAETHGIERIVFPGISTGVYRFPRRRAASIAVGQTAKWLADHPAPRLVTFCCFALEDEEVYRDTIASMTSRA